jgi:hypothetical protein
MAIDSKMICFTCSSYTWSKASFFCLDSESSQYPLPELEHIKESSILHLIRLDFVLCSTQRSGPLPSRYSSIFWSMLNLVGVTPFQCEQSLGSLLGLELAGNLSSRLHVLDQVLTCSFLIRFLHIRSAQAIKPITEIIAPHATLLTATLPSVWNMLKAGQMHISVVKPPFLPR